MDINDILNSKGMTKYRLAKLSGVPHATLSELCNGKTNIEKCSAETLYKIAKTLDVSMESLLEERMLTLAWERSYEHGLPSYLQHDLEVYKKGLAENSSLLDCYWGELCGSINIAEINEGLITHEHTEYLRHKYLWR